MFTDNRTTFIKREILTKISKLAFENKLVDEIDKIPFEIIDKSQKPIRCCYYKDRAIVKFRTVACMGFDLKNEDEIDYNSLSFYAKKISEREEPEFPILTFIDEACRSCIRANYFITNVCRNCVAQPCIENCPKDAIIKNSEQAEIIAEKCINCGICKKVCPYHAVVYVPVPCEEACPVNAIYKDENGKEEIDYQKCIFCGKCIKACPFGAVIEKSQIVDIINQINLNNETVAMIAPSIIGQYNASIYQIAKAIKQLGFKYVVEVATGAEITAKTESEELKERLKKGDKLMGTSCCPAYVEAVEKHAPEFLPYVSHAKTPMSYTAEICKKEIKNAITVFMGPCVAKKHECIEDPNVEYAITFEELDSMFKSKNIDPEKIQISENETNILDLHEGNNIGRMFPVSSGVANSVKLLFSDKEIELRPLLINGFTDFKSVRQLAEFATNGCDGNLVEIMSCEGGCMCGPGVIEKPAKAIFRLNNFLKNK